MSTRLPIKVKLKRLNKHADLPTYQTDGAVGMDLYCPRDLTIRPHDTVLVSLGFAIELPRNFEAQVRSRSSMAGRGLVVANSPGTIDPDYRGEVKILLHNTYTLTLHVGKGTRVAQLVFAPVVRGTWELVNELSETHRGTGGFGSTGR